MNSWVVSTISIHATQTLGNYLLYEAAKNQLVGFYNIDHRLNHLKSHSTHGSSALNHSAAVLSHVKKCFALSLQVYVRHRSLKDGLLTDEVSSSFIMSS